MSTTVCFLVAVCVIAYITHPAPVESQCTARHCFDDDNDVKPLTTMMHHISDTVERHHQECQQSLLQQRTQFEELQKQFNDSMQQRTQFEELQKQFNDSMQQQRTQFQELRQLLSGMFILYNEVLHFT